MRRRAFHPTLMETCALSASRGSEPVPAFDGKRHGVKITPVGVEVLEINEQAFVVDEMRAGVPGGDVQFDQPIARHPEGGDVFDARARIIAEVPRRRDTDQPFLAAERAETLRDAPVPCDPGEAEPDMRQLHDPQPPSRPALRRPGLQPQPDGLSQLPS